MLWVRAGLLRALLDLDDYEAAREEARLLQAADKTGSLSLPSQLLLALSSRPSSSPWSVLASSDRPLSVR